MSLEDQKALSRRALDMWSSNNADSAEEVFSADYVNHQEPGAVESVGSVDLKAWQAIVAENHSAFSNFMVDIQLQVAEGEFVANHWRFTATNTGDYLGNPPTGKTVSWTGVQIDRFANGKIVESWVSWDKFTMFHGLGLVQ